jgi:hypothetical protein
MNKKPPTPLLYKANKAKSEIISNENKPID